MIGIKVADADSIPEEIFNRMLKKFEDNRELGPRPPIGAIDLETGDIVNIGWIGGIAKSEQGEIIIFLDLDINMNLSEETGEILGLVLKSETLGEENAK